MEPRCLTAMYMTMTGAALATAAQSTDCGDAAGLVVAGEEDHGVIGVAVR